MIVVVLRIIKHFVFITAFAKADKYLSVLIYNEVIYD